MKIQCLTLRQFRLYEDSTLHFHGGVNSIIGPNATGKTTVLEAIYCLLTGYSFRTRHMDELQRYGRTGFFIEIEFEKHGIEQSLKIHYDGKKKNLFLNDTPLPNGSSLIGVIQGVVLTPDHISLIKGAPQMRRQFLDLQIGQADPLYVHHLMRYTRALKQRNTLLRSKVTETLESWEKEMAASAAYLVETRQKAVACLSRLAEGYYQTLSKETCPLQLHYKTIGQARTAEEYSAQFFRHRKRELELGMTLTGPHRDEVNIFLADREACHFASEGQKQTLVAALYLAKWERIRSQIQEMPLMLVDDVGIGMDSKRKQAFLEVLEGLGQVVITATAGC